MFYFGPAFSLDEVKWVCHFLEVPQHEKVVMVGLCAAVLGYQAYILCNTMGFQHRQEGKCSGKHVSGSTYVTAVMAWKIIANAQNRKLSAAVKTNKDKKNEIQHEG